MKKSLNDGKASSNRSKKSSSHTSRSSSSFISRKPFIYDVSNLEFPIDYLYYDTQHTRPKSILDLTDFTLTKSLFTLLSTDFQHCKTLILTRCSGLTESRMESFQYFFQLTTLHLQGTMNISVNLANIIANFSKLIELDISENTIEPKSLMTMLPKLSSLKTLICCKCQGLDDFSMQAIALCVQQHRKLANINLSNVSSFTDEGALALFTISMNILHDINISGCNSLTTLTMTAFRKRMSVLKRLNLSGIRHIGQSAFELISEGCHFVTVLDLSHNATLDDAGLILIGKRCHHIQILNLNHCTNISDEGISGFIEYHVEDGAKPTVSHLDLSGCVKCSAGTGFALSQIGSSLLTLKLNCLSQITTVSMKALWETLDNLENFEMCADLRSSGTHRRSIIPHISDQIILSGHMKTIRRLHITGACMVGDVGIRWIIQNSPLIEDVDISYCNSITDQSLIEFGTNSTSLQSINLAGLGHLTDMGITSLSLGCKLLKKLNLTACNKLTNHSLESISHLHKLESLNISCCDLLSDEGVFLLSSSLHSLKHLDISNCDQITTKSINLLVQSNPSLCKLSCVGCNILSIEYQKITKSLPFAKAMTSKCRLESRHHSLVRYNSYILQFNQMSCNFTKIQSLIRGWLISQRYKRYLIKRSRATQTLQRVWRGYRSRVGTYHVLKQQKLYTQQVIHLQRSMRRLHAISLTKRKKRYLLKRYRATLLLQRYARGYMARARLYYRFKNHPRYHTKIFYLAQKLFLFSAIKRVKSQIIQIQTAIRCKIYRQKYLKFQKNLKKLQIQIRIFLILKKIQNFLIEEMIEEWSVKEMAIERIIQNWRAKRYNAMIRAYVYDCAVVYRNEYDMREWEYEQQKDNAILIQTHYRGYKARVKYRILKRRHEEGSAAIIIIQKYLRRYLKRIKFIPWRIKMKRISANWRQFYRGELAFFYRKQVKIIQKALQKNVFQRTRKRAAGNIFRVYRGYQARKLVRQMIFEIHCGLAARIQRAWRLYVERKERRFQYARRYIAARRIQRAVKRRLEHKAKQRVIAAKKAKALEMELKRKEKLLREKRLKVMEKIKNTATHRFAIRIQRAWRKYKVELDKKRGAQKAREDMMRELADESQQKKDAVFRFPNPLNTAKRLLHNFNRYVEEANKVDDKDKPKYILSVLKYQTLSIKQVGIIDISMTYGEGERYAFQSRQEFFKSTQKRYYEMINGDLSGHLKLEIYLWIMKGTGTECICELHVRKKPEKSSIAALKNRAVAKRLDGINIAWHERVHIEIHGTCSLKRNESGFAIDAIRICEDMESAQQAKEDGLFMVQDLLAYNLPTSLWAHGKEEPPNENVFALTEIEGEVWFDERMRKCCYKYNLTVEDIYQMRTTWDGIQAGSYDFYAPVFAIWDYMNIPHITICTWLLEAIHPESLLQLSFSEYVHLISFFSVFGLQEKIRFIFGYMCTKYHQTINATQFELIIDYLTEGFTGQKNLLGWKKDFNTYCHPKLKVMFISHFEKFVHEHIRVFWGLDEIQLKFRTYNVGRGYWEAKNEKFIEVRQKLGFVMS